MHLRRIEEASLNAWPALQQILLDGWLLRFSRGYTRRANSVNPLFGSCMDAEEKIAVCEGLYAEKGLLPVFRLTPFASPSRLDQVLDEFGYTVAAPTLVLYLDLAGRCIEPRGPGTLRQEQLERWLDIFYAFSDAPRHTWPTHRDILRAVPSRCASMSLVEAEQAVACGIGVLETDYFGLFDLVTDPDRRNRGYGTGLVTGLLTWAQVNGARHAYLQVMESNEPARRLYAKLGFREAYSYWYRVSEG